MSVLVANHSYFLTLCPLPVTSLNLSFWHFVFYFFPSLFLSLYLSLLISVAFHLSHHHSLLFSLSVGDEVKCSCRPNSPVIGSHLLLPPQCIWNHWLQTSQSKSKPSYKGNAFKGKGVCGGYNLCAFWLCVSAKPTLMYHIVADVRITLHLLYLHLPEQTTCKSSLYLKLCFENLLIICPFFLTSSLSWALIPELCHCHDFQMPWTRGTVRWSAPPWKACSIWWCLETWWERLWCPTTDRSSQFSTSSRTWTVSSSHANGWVLIHGQMVCQHDVSLHFCGAVIVWACHFVL